MDFFIQSALAQSGQAANEPGLASFLPLIILFVVFYFFLIRPQMKKQKEHGKMIKNLAVGDEVVTNGGVLGKITAVDEYFFKVKIAADTEVKIQKIAIAQVMPASTVE